MKLLVLTLMAFLFSCAHNITDQSIKEQLDVNLYFGSNTSIEADAVVNSGNTRFEFFGGGARYISKAVGKLNGKELPDLLREKHGTMLEGDAIISSDTGELGEKFKYIIHVSAVHTAGNPQKSLVPRKLHDQHPLIMGSYKSVKDSIRNSLLVANANGVKSINIPPLATSRGISKKVSIEALKDAIKEYLEIVGKSKVLKKINYIVYIKKKKERNTKMKYIVSQKQAWQDVWSFYF